MSGYNYNNPNLRPPNNVVPYTPPTYADPNRINNYQGYQNYPPPGYPYGNNNIQTHPAQPPPNNHYNDCEARYGFNGFGGGNYSNESEVPHWKGNGIDPTKIYLDENTSINIRHAFIRKVYTLLSMQLLIAFSILLSASLVPSINLFVKQHIGIPIVAGFILTGIMLALLCFHSILQNHPWNLILLFTISVLAGVSLCVSVTRANPVIIAEAIGLTAILFLVVSFFACQTRFDFTGCGIYLLVAVIALLIVSIVGIFIRSRIFHLVIAYFGAVLFTFSIIYDTQLMVGGNRKQQFSIDDYVMATLTLFIDIINLFQYILQILLLHDSSDN